MPDITIIPSTKSKECVLESTILKSILEEISLECVLADISEPESFSQLLALLKQFFQKAKECNFPELAEDAKKAGKLVKTIMEHRISSSINQSDNISQNMPEIENQVESVNLIISEMKSFLHFITRSYEEEKRFNQVDQSEDSLSPKLRDAEQSSVKDADNQSSDDFKLKDDPAVQPTSATILESDSTTTLQSDAADISTEQLNLTHPGELPSFLNIDDFAEFLSLQKNILNSMEVLILDIEKNNNREYAKGELKRLFHTTKGEAGFLGLKEVEKVCHLSEDLMEKEHCENIVDTLLAVKDWLETTYNIYAGRQDSGRQAALPSLEELFDSRRQQSGSDKKTPIIDLDSSNTLPNKKSQPSENSSNPIPSENLSKPISPENLYTPILTDSINVDASRLDKMVNIIGELAITESMISQSPEITASASPTLLRALSSLHKITRELQTLGLSLRMVPLKSLFNKMDRLVRDLAKKTGKQIQFVIKGEQTELDKTVVDKLGDPLIHILRNSVDHGVEESVKDRLDLGKPETSTIELRAFHKGGSLFIEIEDDGRGVNRKRLAEKALSQGITIKSISQHGEVLSYENINHIDKIFGDEILNLVFHQGLSTAREVTDVSGRGVGMDVVRKSIEACRGKVSIISKEGRGTTCTIKIPLTLSIIDGLVVRVAQDIFVIPTLSVVTSLKVDKKDISNVFEKGEMINVLGRLIPLFRLKSLFNLSHTVEKDISDQIVVVVEESGLHTALLVDELLGKQNTVIKSLGMGVGMGIEDIKGISGGTIMPDGRVSLILDIAGIIELSHGA